MTCRLSFSYPESARSDDSMPWKQCVSGSSPLHHLRRRSLVVAICHPLAVLFDPFLSSSRLGLRRLLREFLDLEHTQLFRLSESFASFFEDRKSTRLNSSH